MNNYKEILFLLSSLIAIYFFKDVITIFLVLLILLTISLLIVNQDININNNLQYYLS